MVLECCVCGFPEDGAENRGRKAKRRLPLCVRPEVLLLEFKTSYDRVCQFCLEDNQKQIEKFDSKSSYTPLEVHNAVRKGQAEMCKLMLRKCPRIITSDGRLWSEMDAPIDEDPTAKSGDNCLHIIARRGYWHLARYILMQVVPNNSESRRGAVNQKNAIGQTSLTIASETSGREDMVLLFCKAGADPNYILNDTTNLMRAAVSGQDMAIDILHRYGARLDERSEANGRTALMKAALFGELNCVRMLLRAGADRRCRDWNGVSAIVHAERRAMLDINYDAIAEVLVPREFAEAAKASEIESGTTLSVAKSDAALAFRPHQIVDVQGETWDACFDEICDCAFYTNSGSGMSTYLRPTSADEIWEMEESEREAKRKIAAEADKRKWEENWDPLAEAPYWIHADRPDDIVWECPRGLKPSGKGKPKSREAQAALQEQYYGQPSNEGEIEEWGSLMTEEDAEERVKGDFKKQERKRAVKSQGGKNNWAKLKWTEKLRLLKEQRAHDKENARQKQMEENPGFYDEYGSWYTYAYDEYNGYWDEEGNYYYGETTAVEGTDEAQGIEETDQAGDRNEAVLVTGGYGISYNQKVKSREGENKASQAWVFEECPKPKRIAALTAEEKMSERQKRLLGGRK